MSHSRYALARWPARQGGAVLVVGLILLVVITLVGVAAMQGTTLQEKMAGNLRDSNLSFQASEAVLRTLRKHSAAGLRSSGQPCSVLLHRIRPSSIIRQGRRSWTRIGHSVAGLHFPYGYRCQQGCPQRYGFGVWIMVRRAFFSRVLPATVWILLLVIRLGGEKQQRGGGWWEDKDTDATPATVSSFRLIL